MYDAIIIGSGPGGYECAKRIVELNGKAAIIEKDKIGGICTNYGCIPTKALHASAQFFLNLKKASKFGFSSSLEPVDLSSLMQRKDRIVKIMSQGIEKTLKDNNVEIIKGEAKIKDKNTVIVEEKVLETKSIVIATGAKPKLLPGITAITSKELLELKELPSSLIIIGGGYIGCEFASIFSSLGTKVTIIEALPSIINTEDNDISNELTKLMQRQGVNILTNSEILSTKENIVEIKQENEIKNLQADKILISIGAEPYFDKKEMDNLGVKYEKGITINNKMQTFVDNIYAVGDVTNKIKLAHYASAQAEIAANNIMNNPIEFDETNIPSTIFTLPEISSVGVKDENLKNNTFYFAANGKARAMSEADGFVKIFHEEGYLKGFCAIGPHASDLVAEATLAIKNKIPLKKIKETIHPHPTLSEVFLGAVEMALKED